MVIPNIVHFVYGLKEQTTPFTFMSYMAIKSAIVVNRPEKVNFIFHYEPFGYWWNAIKPDLTLVHVPLLSHIKDKEIKKHQNMADIYRLLYLQKEGGIYLDIDTISIKPWHNLLNSGAPMIMGQEYDYGLCNAVMMSEPNSEFIKIWFDVYDKHFKPDGWTEASVFLPLKIAQVYIDKIMVLPQDFFFYPGCREFNMIFKETPHREISINATSLHLWNTMNSNLCDYIDPSCLIYFPDIMYSEFLRRVISFMTEQERTEFSNLAKPFTLNCSILTNYALTYGLWRNFHECENEIPIDGKSCSLASTQEVREFLSTFDEKIETIIDLGCGSCNWFSTTPQFKNAVEYKGIDCSYTLLDRNSNKYHAPKYQFFISDLKENTANTILKLANHDLVVLYNVLEHCTLEDCGKILKNTFELSPKFILVSTSDKENTELSDLLIATRNVEKLGIDPSYEIKHKHPKFLLLSKI